LASECKVSEIRLVFDYLFSPMSPKLCWRKFSNGMDVYVKKWTERDSQWGIFCVKRIMGQVIIQAVGIK
jgi:hypothetical protein